MTRFLAVAAAAAATLALTPVAGMAQSPSGYYTAVAAAPTTKASIVTRSTIWRCAETTCVAAKATSRDAIMCELVAREVGKLESFTAGGAAFDADALGRCNARAK